LLGIEERSDRKREMKLAKMVAARERTGKEMCGKSKKGLELEERNLDSKTTGEHLG